MATFLIYNFAKSSPLESITVLRQAYRYGRPFRVWDIHQARYASFTSGQHVKQENRLSSSPFQLDAYPSQIVASPIRCYSTQNNPTNESKAKSDEKKPEQPKKKGFFGTAKSTVKDVLIPGCKELWADSKASRANKKKLRANNRDYTTLTRAEYYKIIQTSRDLRKAFPLIFIFMLPASGAYLAPLFIIISPRLALSPQFYSERQRIEFPQLDIKSRRKGYTETLEQLSEVGEKITSNDLTSLCQKISNKHNPTNEEIQEIAKSFKDPSLSLSKLPFKHLSALSQSWFLLRYLPSGLLAWRLKGLVKEIQLDDEALSREGVGDLSHKELKQACFDRGLNATDLEDDDMRNWLKNWVDLSVTHGGEDLSFLAHLIAFKSSNYGKFE